MEKDGRGCTKGGRETVKLEEERRAVGRVRKVST